MLWGMGVRNVQRFRSGLVFKVHRLLYHTTLGLRVTKKKQSGRRCDLFEVGGALQEPPLSALGEVARVGLLQPVQFVQHLRTSESEPTGYEPLDLDASAYRGTSLK